MISTFKNTEAPHKSVGVELRLGRLQIRLGIFNKWDSKIIYCRRQYNRRQIGFFNVAICWRKMPID